MEREREETRISPLSRVRVNLAKYERMIQNGAMGGNTTSQTIDGKVRRVDPIPHKYNDPENKRYIHIPEPEIPDDPWGD